MLCPVVGWATDQILTRPPPDQTYGEISAESQPGDR